MGLNQRLFYLLFPALGAAGFLLRALQLRFGFEADTGLALAGYPAGSALLLLAALLAALALAAARVLPAAPPADGAPSGGRSVFGPAAAALLTAVMGLSLLAGGRGGHPAELLLGLAALATALHMFLAPRAAGGLRIFCAMETALFYVVWLVVLFSRHATDPVLMGFWPPLLALCAAAFSFYFSACAACGHPEPRRCLFSLLLGGSLALIAAADGCIPAPAPALWGFLAAALLQFSAARAWLTAPKT